ncbi:MAG: hypothetical protein WCW35_07230 [Bacteroidota bacterium]
MTEKIGIGVITCNRRDLFEQCIQSIPGIGPLIVVNDGQPYPVAAYPKRVTAVVQHSVNKGVGASKNEAFKFLLQEQCDHIFIIEDDIKIIDPSVFEKYITAARESGILHFNFGYHGPLNRDKNGNPAYRKVFTVSERTSIVFNRYVVGAFSYYNSEVLRQVGMMDWLFINAYEHIDHSVRIIKAGYHPPFWWFADILNSEKYISDLDPQLVRSVIRFKKFSLRMKVSLLGRYFKLKHGHFADKFPDAYDDRYIEEFMNKKKSV